MRRVKLILCFNLMPIFFYGQNIALDSLKTRLTIATGESKISLMISLSEEYRSIDYDSCFDFGVEALDLAKFQDNKLLQAIASRSLGISYFYRNNFEESYYYYNNSYQIYKKLGDSNMMARCSRNIGLLLQEWGKYKEANELNLRASLLYELINDKKGLAFSTQQQGNVFYYQGMIKEALDQYLKALSIFKKIEDYSASAQLYNDLGIIYSELKEFEITLAYYEKAIYIYNNIVDDNRQLSKVLSNMAEIYNFDYNDYNHSLELYQHSLEIKNQINDRIGIAYTLNNMGTVYGNKSSFDTALTYFVESMFLFTKVDAFRGLIMVHHNIGNIHQATEDYTKAIHFYQKSLSKATDYKYIDYISSNQKALFECYAAICNKEKFNEYFQLYSAGVDTIIDRINRAEMLEIESKYRYEEINKQNETLQDQLIIQNGLVNKYRNYSYGLAAITIIVLVIFGLIIIKK